ncbi:MAG: DUF389 domain-containing protein, partial [Blastocatellia bacterium]|nr:DUF389 domain-containing protein [Blastocatellia bacterium]
MSGTEEARMPVHHVLDRYRDWFARSLDVSPERKEEIYIELCRSASLEDVSYWLQILFSSGIATLGLVLNSPAVIIGAMLISPLMGPILAAGLSLAAGDIILGLRSVVKLAVSCLVALTFALLLVGLLPFKEMTGEIAARTQPNTLDLFVALFSGAIGSIAICREVKGVVTSIPGVAIAVALMPPLCVVGYGLGIAFSVGMAEGMRAASGGGLLFLTNLVAITFTSMVVFLALHIDTEKVKASVREWNKKDRECILCENILKRFHISHRIWNIGSLRSRFLLIAIPIMIILIPLSQSFIQLKREIEKKREENRIERTAKELWQQGFEKLPGGAPRSYIDLFSVSQQAEKLMLYMRVFTSKPYEPAEKDEFARMVAVRLNRPMESVGLQLVEIPTASSELAARAGEETRVEAPPTVAELQMKFFEGVASALGDLQLPPPARLLDYDVTTSAADPLRLTVSYLSEREIEADAQTLIASSIRIRLRHPNAKVVLRRVPSLPGRLIFRRNESTLTPANTDLLDRAGEALQQRPKLRIEVIIADGKGERMGIAGERARSIAEYLASKWQVSYDRLRVSESSELQRAAILKVEMAGS